MKHIRIRAGVVGAAIIAATGVLAAPSSQAGEAHSSVDRAFSVIPGSVLKTTDARLGAYVSSAMSVEVALAPSHAAKLKSFLASESSFVAAGRPPIGGFPASTVLNGKKYS